MTRHEYIRPGKVVISDGGPGLLPALGLIAACAFITAAAWFAITYALILGAGMAVGCTLIAAGVWYLHRRFAVVAYNPRFRVLRASAVVLPSPPAPQRAVPVQAAGVIGAQRPIPADYVITDAKQRQS
jgi:hypothetical protein